VDRIVGLEIGADDYIAKPFNPRELLARIRAVLRRAQNRPAAEPETVTRFGAFELDLNAHRLTRDDKPVPLTSGEFDLLVILVAHPNKVLDRDRLLDLLTGAERSPFDRSIDVRVTRCAARSAESFEPVYQDVWGKDTCSALKVRSLPASPMTRAASARSNHAGAGGKRRAIAATAILALNTFVIRPVPSARPMTRPRC
jgi:hypothetical protein